MTIFQQPKGRSVPQSVIVAALTKADHLFQDPWTRKDAAGIHNCAIRLQSPNRFDMEASQQGCHHPHCPICQHQKAYEYGHQIDEVFRGSHGKAIVSGFRSSSQCVSAKFPTSANAWRP